MVEVDAVQHLTQMHEEVRSHFVKRQTVYERALAAGKS